MLDFLGGRYKFRTCDPCRVKPNYRPCLDALPSAQADPGARCQTTRCTIFTPASHHLSGGTRTLRLGAHRGTVWRFALRKRGESCPWMPLGFT